MYVRTAAYRLAGQGIVVSSIDPGWVRTDMGMAVATEDYGPDREPEEAARDLLELAERQPETGQFWKYGKQRPW